MNKLPLKSTLAVTNCPSDSPSSISEYKFNHIDMDDSIHRRLFSAIESRNAVELYIRGRRAFREPLMDPCTILSFVTIRINLHDKIIKII